MCEWIMKLWYIPAAEYFSTMKRMKFDTHNNMNKSHYTEWKKSDDKEHLLCYFICIKFYKMQTNLL